jgi:DNA (cytosine-5)-methyltransferase 1
VKAYYNENDPYAASWLRRLIAANLITHGVVDERPIQQVKPDELRGYVCVHLFAGAGGWDLALKIAGWPVDRPVWTGSCPCQPFSAAGKQKAYKDERHLWPEMFRLIRECRPDVVFGEQVSGAIGHGWLDGVCADLEGEGYAVGETVLGAHSVKSPHKRQRLFLVAVPVCDSNGGDAEDGEEQCSRKQRLQQNGGVCNPELLVSTNNSGSTGAWEQFQVVGCSDGKSRRVGCGVQPLAHGIPSRKSDGRMGYLLSQLEQLGYDKKTARRMVKEARNNRGGRLRGFGNAIVPQVAAIFIRAFMEVT